MTHDTSLDTCSQNPAPAPHVRLEDLSPELRAACEGAGWSALTPVQEAAIPTLLAGRDVKVQARTGSGKTGAFLLPMIKRLKTDLGRCQALVLVPTRELAKQVAREAETLFARTGLGVAAVYGGVGYGAQIEAFKSGAQLVVGTPGRILDHLLKRSLVLDDISMLVFDEADRMLSIGFYPDMKEVQRYLPRRRILSCMFSATFPGHVLRLAEEFLVEPETLCLSADEVHVSTSEHSYFEVPPMDRERCLVRILEVERPTQAIIFCNTKADVHFVTAVLQQFGYDADELSADLTQGRREEVLARMRAKTLRFLVATDVAGRGIDIPDLSHVILYQPPEDREAYIHRAGRTGRAGAEGIVFSLVDVMQKMELQRLARMYNIHLVRRELPGDEAVAEAVAERLTALLETRLRKKTSLERERMARFHVLARRLAEDPESINLLALLLDEVYQQELHARPVLPESSGSGGAGAPAREDGDGNGRRRRRRRPKAS